MKRSLCVIFLACLTATRVFAEDSFTLNRVSIEQLPLSFEENVGQTDNRVKFLTRGEGYALFLTPKEAVLSLMKRPAPTDIFDGRPNGLKDKPHDTVRIKLIGASPHPKMMGRGLIDKKSNYYIGNSPQHWRSDVRSYTKVEYSNVYPGIDLVYYGKQRQLEYDFLIQPGVNPKVIEISFKGPDRLTIDENGALLLDFPDGIVSLHKPHIYQESENKRKEIEGGYLLKGSGRIGFQIGAYDRDKPLVIDPVLSYSTYLGGSGADIGRALTVDASGNVYITGSTESVDFPTTAQAGNRGSTDIFVSKINPTGTAVLYSTYLGGSDQDQGNAIAVDNDGSIYVTGSTVSKDFPTKNALQSTLHCPPPNHEIRDQPDCTDAFVVKLTQSGTLDYGTYLGGTENDTGNGIAVDAVGNVYLVGKTRSADFPMQNPIQSSLNLGSSNICIFDPSVDTMGNEIDRHPCYDIFITKLNLHNNGLVYSTYLGGGENDAGTGVVLDSSGNIYLTGYTQSSDFPTKNPIQGKIGSGSCSDAELNWPCPDAFITKLDSSGSGLIYSTYLGGSGPGTSTDSFEGSDVGRGIALDKSGNVYITGETFSTDFPTTRGAFQTTLSWDSSLCPRGPCADTFITKLNPQGSALLYSSYLGGSTRETAGGIAVDSSGNAYLVGSTDSTNFPTVNPIQPARMAGCDRKNEADSCIDAFIAKFGAEGDKLVYSSYLGGSKRDQAFGVAVDPHRSAYLIGQTESADFPTTSGTIQATNHGAADAFIAKISDLPSPPSGSGTFTDSFNRPDSTDLGSSWNEYLPDLIIANNEVTNANADNQPKAAVITQKIGPDQEVAVDCKVAGPGNACGVMARWSNEQNFYRARLDAGQGNLVLSKTVGGETTTLAAVSRPLQSNIYYSLRLVVQGSSLSLFFANESSPALSITDASIPQGDFAGIRSFAAAPRSTFFDNFSASALSAQGADLSLSMTATPAKPSVGNSLIYAMTVTNLGPSAATGATLIDTLPDGVDLLSTAASQGACTPGTGKVSCDLGNLAGQGTATVSVIVNPKSAGSIKNSASITAKESDPNPKNNQAQLTTSVSAKTATSADLSVTFSAAPNPVTAGSNLTETLTVTNLGPAAAEGVTLSHTMTGSANFVSAVSSAGNCSGNGSLLCLLGTINPGSSITVTLVETPTAQGGLVDSAVVTSDTSDPNPINNSTSATVTVSAPLPETPAGSATPGGGAPPPGGNPPPDVVATDNNTGGGGCSIGGGREEDVSLSAILVGAVLVLLFRRRKLV